jgi:uncharacterized protein (DUF2236 family)
MIVGGVGALLLQTLHPLAMAGVAEHSDYRRRPLARLSRTSSFVTATTYAATPVAEQIIEAVKAVHLKVVGVAPDGRPYRASDPELLRWVHVAEVASFLEAHCRYNLDPVRGADLDRYFEETAVVAERVGATAVPRSRAEVEAYFDEVRPQLAVGHPGGANPVVAGAYAVVAQAGIGLLPRWARRMLGLDRPDVVELAVVRPATCALLIGLRVASPRSPVLAQARARCAARPST